MPIDPTIPLGVQPIRMPNPLEILSQFQQLQVQQENARTLREEREAAAEQRRQQTAAIAQANQDRADIAQALHEGKGVRGATLAWATNHAPHTIPTLTKFFDESDESAAKIQKLQGDLNNARLDHLGHMADGVLTHGTTPDLLQGGLSTALQLYKEQFPQEANDVDRIGQHLMAASPDAVRTFLEQTRSAAPYYQAIQMKQAERGPSTVAAGATLVSPEGKPLFTAPEHPSFQQKDVMLDGKRAIVNFDPHSGKATDASGQDVTSRITPIPPASLIINDQRRQASTMPDFALSDARPVGREGNKPDPTIRMTPNGLYQAAQAYIANGQYPPTGRGTDPIAIAQREAINAKVGAIAAAAGLDVPSLRAFYKSNAASLAQQQKAADAVQSFMNTADKNTELLRAAVQQLPDTGIPLLNQPLRSFQKNVVGDPNMSKVAAYLQSIQNEYSRIIAQPNLAGQLTDSARREGGNLIDPKATVQQMIASIEALHAEGANRLLSTGEQIQRIMGRMQGATSGGVSTPATAPAPTAESLEHRVWRVGGKVGPEPK